MRKTILIPIIVILNLRRVFRFRFSYQSANLLWLFNYAVSVTNFTASSCWIVSELRIQKDMERSGRGLIWGTFSEFVSSDWGKPWIILIVTVDVSTKIKAFGIQARNATIRATILDTLLSYTSFPCTLYIISPAVDEVLLYDKGTSIVLWGNWIFGCSKSWQGTEALCKLILSVMEHSVYQSRLWHMVPFPYKPL